MGISEKKPAPTLKEFCTKRIEPYAKPQRFWIWYRAGIRALLKYPMLANARLDEITSEVTAGFAAWRLADEIQPCSINSNLRVLRRILRLAVDWGLIAAAPKIRLLDDEARRERVVTPEEEEAYLAVASPFLRDVAVVLFDTGMRPDELHRMRWEHVTWPNGRYGTILGIYGKTKAARRHIPMTPRVCAVLDARWKVQKSPDKGWVWPAGTKTGHINHSSVRRDHRHALKLSKVAPFVLYSLRHTFLTRLGASGCDVWTLMRIAGHSNIAMSMRYVHPQEELIQRAFANMGGTASQQIAKTGRHKIGHTQEQRLLKAGRKDRAREHG